MATDLGNLTPFALDSAFAYGVDARAMLVLCVAGRFRLPAAGTRADGPLQLADEQPPPAMADVHWGDPATTSLRFAGQGLAHRNGPEVYLSGAAVAPRGRAMTEMMASLRLGDCSKQIRVIGDRYWTRGLVGLRPSRTEPFTEMPLTYERAFGGTSRQGESIVACDARNPVGRGHHADAAAAVDHPLPNLEAPESRVSYWNDVAEVSGFGPIPGAWQPRLAHAGTYDDRWVDERAPLWPEDIAPAYFCSAALSLSLRQPLRGGEPAVLEGFSVDGVIAFRLPTHRLVAKSYYGHRTIREPLTLDGVLIEPGDGAVTLIWRGVMPLGHGPRAHLRSIVRLLEPWEDPIDA